MLTNATPRVIPVSIGAFVAALAMALVLISPVAAAETLTAVLLGSEEVPGPGDTDGSGAGFVDVDAAGGTLCYLLSINGIDIPTAAHIHEAADGVAGLVVVTLATPTGAGPAGPYASFACAANPGDYNLVNSGDPDVATLLADIEANPQNYYVNVHTAAFPAGAVRGQLAVQVAATAASYINPDTGAATANPDVNANSDCGIPDQADTQQVSPAGMTTNNVHNDACLSDAIGFDVDGQVSFESSGVGVISGCPDPDAAGPKTATNTGTRCTLTGYQETGAIGDFQYHARVNSEVAGTQTVVVCADPEGDGCGNATVSDTITVTWIAAAVVPAAAPTPAVSALPNAAIAPDDGISESTGLAVILAALALGSITFMGYRTLATRRTR